MSRILSQRLASGLGAGDQPWVEEWRSAFWEIVRKAQKAKIWIVPEFVDRLKKDSRP